MAHISRKSIIEKRAALRTGGQASIQHASNASNNGGIRSTRCTQYSGMGRRRRQSKSKVEGGGLGADSSEDTGAGRKQVRFEGSKDIEVADRIGVCRLYSNSFDVASVDVADVEVVLDKGQDCACCLCTCLVCEATVSSAVTAWYPSHSDDKHDNNTFSDKDESDNGRDVLKAPQTLATPPLKQQSTQPELTSQSHRPQILN